MNPLPQPSAVTLAAYLKWRTDNGHGAIPNGDEHDTLMWCAGYDQREREIDNMFGLRAK